MWKCYEIDYMTDESKRKLAEIIPNIENYFGDGMDNYDHLYEEIHEYLSNVRSEMNDMIEEITTIDELMCNDRQNEMIEHLCKLHMILCNIPRPDNSRGAND